MGMNRIPGDLSQQNFNPNEDMSQLNHNLNDPTESFFELMETQMVNFVKEIEKKLNSVRKERE